MLLGVGGPYEDGPTAVFEWNGFKQDGIEECVNRGVCTDAQRQRHNRNEGKCGPLDERPQSVLKILYECEHRCTPLRYQEPVRIIAFLSRVAAAVCQPPALAGGTEFHHVA